MYVSYPLGLRIHRRVLYACGVVEITSNFSSDHSTLAIC